VRTDVLTARENRIAVDISVPVMLLAQQSAKTGPPRRLNGGRMEMRHASNGRCVQIG